MSEHIEISDRDGVRQIRINRLERKNALTHAMYAAMTEAINGAQTDPALRVVILTGAGDVFTAGNDLKDFIESPPRDLDNPAPVHLFLNATLNADKPLLAAVNGIAVGVGTTILLHCDIVYAAESAVFSAPFVDLGLVPEAASSLLFPMTAGARRAAEMFLLGQRLNAAEALQCGLVSRVFPDEQLQDRIAECARILTSKPPAALRNAKALLKKNRAGAAQRMREEGELFAVALQSDEFAEAASAFMEKRPADFSRFS